MGSEMAPGQEPLAASLACSGATADSPLESVGLPTCGSGLLGRVRLTKSLRLMSRNRPLHLPTLSSAICVSTKPVKSLLQVAIQSKAFCPVHYWRSQTALEWQGPRLFRLVGPCSA
eukprot:5498663-Pyramimonas_sp.AAC.1